LLISVLQLLDRTSKLADLVLETVDAHRKIRVGQLRKPDRSATLLRHGGAGKGERAASEHRKFCDHLTARYMFRGRPGAGRAGESSQGRDAHRRNVSSD
jgi:hypothetical protein